MQTNLPTEIKIVLHQYLCRRSKDAKEIRQRMKKSPYDHEQGKYQLQRLKLSRDFRKAIKPILDLDWEACK